MRLIDSHAHLDDPAFDTDRAALIATLHRASIGAITVGASLRSSEASCRLAARHRGIWATVGIHPHNAKTADRPALDALEALIREHAPVAVGEIGLDYYRDLSPRDRQRAAFRAQLALASRHRLPIILHNRDSTEDLLAILGEASARPPGVVHSFLGDAALAKRFLALGLHLGIGGPLTFPKNGALRAAVAAVPMERLLVETDCPYLTPVPHRGHRNEPGYVRYVVAEIARLKDLPEALVARETTANAARLFALDASPASA
jgi:TatD DNase family protein